jgi:fibronectin type 3 domain-containing protein
MNMRERLLSSPTKPDRIKAGVKKRRHEANAPIPFLCLLTVILMLASCGGGGSQGVSSEVVSGVAATGAPLAGETRIKDSSTPAREKTTVIGSDGSFAFDVSDMQGPFILRATGSAQGTNYTLYSFAEKSGTANINPLSSALVANAAGVDDPAEIYERPAPATLEKIKSGLPDAVAALRSVIKRLLLLYGAENAHPIKDLYRANHEGLDGMFDNVKITLSKGILTIINAKTGVVIFTGKISDFRSAYFTDNDDDLPKPGSPPVAPTDVTATGGAGQVTISWQAVGNATSYNIYWATTPGVTTSSGTKIVGAKSPHIHTGLLSGTTYYYVVTAVNGAGEGEPSDPVWATTLAGGTQPPALPAVPTGVMAVGGTNQVTISWSPVSGADSCNIYWSTTSGVTTVNGTKITGATSPMVQTRLAPSTTYYYVVTAVNSAGESAASIQVAATTLTPAPPPPTVPAAPTGVSATGGVNQVTVSWSSVTGANSYNVYGSTTSGVTVSSGTKIAGVTSPYVHTGLSASTAYYYIVTAMNGAGESAASSQATATTSAPAPTVPAAPTGVTATGGTKQVSISWSAVSGATSYNLYWSTTSGVTPGTGTKIAGATSPYIQTGLADSTVYYYVVTAQNSAGESPASSQATATTAAPALDGAALYASTCQGCHGPLAAPTRPIRNKTVSGIRNANMAWGLTDAQLQAIIAVLP